MILNTASVNSIQFCTHAMTFQSINKINRSTPNITAHSTSSPLAVAFRYKRSKPSLAILLINAVLSSQGKCVCVPLVRCVFFRPPTTPQAKRGMGEAEACSLQLCPYSQHLTGMPRCAHRQQQQFEQCKSPVRLRHLQMQPHYLT